MNRVPSIAVLLALLAPALGAEPAGTLLAPGPAEAQWRPLIDSMAAKGAVVAPFTERRYFPFRREPTVLSGVLRFSPERGLSLEYTRPEESIVIADSGGLLLRDREGRARQMPSGSRGPGAVASLLPIMRFDLASLYPRFSIRAFGSGASWRLEFTPLGSGAAADLGLITVEGAGTSVVHLQFRRSDSQRIEIDVGAARTGGAFTAAELARFFR
jgi:hypothetical protein